MVVNTYYAFDFVTIDIVRYVTAVFPDGPGIPMLIGPDLPVGGFVGPWTFDSGGHAMLVSADLEGNGIGNIYALDPAIPTTLTQLTDLPEGHAIASQVLDARRKPDGSALQYRAEARIRVS